jgi:hypothetical protein
LFFFYVVLFSFIYFILCYSFSVGYASPNTGSSKFVAVTPQRPNFSQTIEKINDLILKQESQLPSSISNFLQSTRGKIFFFFFLTYVLCSLCKLIGCLFYFIFFFTLFFCEADSQFSCMVDPNGWTCYVSNVSILLWRWKNRALEVFLKENKNKKEKLTQ